MVNNSVVKLRTFFKKKEKTYTFWQDKELIEPIWQNLTTRML